MSFLGLKPRNCTKIKQGGKNQIIKNVLLDHQELQKSGIDLFFMVISRKDFQWDSATMFRDTSASSPKTTRSFDLSEGDLLKCILVKTLKLARTMINLIQDKVWYEDQSWTTYRWMIKNEKCEEVSFIGRDSIILKSLVGNFSLSLSFSNTISGSSYQGWTLDPRCEFIIAFTIDIYALDQYYLTSPFRFWMAKLKPKVGVLTIYSVLLNDLKTKIGEATVKLKALWSHSIIPSI